MCAAEGSKSSSPLEFYGLGSVLPKLCGSLNVKTDELLKRF